MTEEEHFFDFAAEVGLTKHLGSIESTNLLVELCQIAPDSTVLDVGCGVGVTPCYLAKAVGCRVVGVDILPKMVERAQARAAKMGLSDRVEFRVADAQDLPFEEGRFDAVITESVTAFPEDKQLAVNEYARVLKAGGYVGLNESTWLKTPPPPELVDWVQQDVGATVTPQTAEGWQDLLVKAGFEDILVKLMAVDVKAEGRGILQRYGLGGMLSILARTLRLYLRNPNYRQFVKTVNQQGMVPEGYREYFGYGIFVGRKPA